MPAELSNLWLFFRCLVAAGTMTGILPWLVVYGVVELVRAYRVPARKRRENVVSIDSYRRRKVRTA